MLGDMNELGNLLC